MNVYVYKMLQVPESEVKAVAKLLKTDLPEPAFIKAEVCQAKYKYMPLSSGEYMLEDLLKAINAVKDTEEKNCFLRKLSNLSVKDDEWLVVEDDGYEV